MTLEWNFVFLIYQKLIIVNQIRLWKENISITKKTCRTIEKNGFWEFPFWLNLVDQCVTHRSHLLKCSLTFLLNFITFYIPKDAQLKVLSIGVKFFEFNLAVWKWLEKCAKKFKILENGQNEKFSFFFNNLSSECLYNFLFSIKIYCFHIIT